MKRKQTILITGATTGIGRHAALHLARKGHRVIATGRNAAALGELSAEATGLDLHTLALDVTSQESISEAARGVERLTQQDGIDVLINNAGYGMAAPMAELTEADLRAQFETNVFGLHNVTRAFLPGMMARRRGRVINVSSIGGRVTFPLFGAYNASKYAVEAMSDALRYEAHPFGIQVVLVEPGPVRSEFGNRTMSGVQRYRSDASPYAAIYARAEEIQRQTDRTAVGPEHTSRAIERAIMARKPPARLVVPVSARVLVWALRWMPVPVSDFLMRRVSGLTPAGLGLAPSAGKRVLPPRVPAE